MKLKKILLFIFILFGSMIVSSKVSAASITYCNYGNGLKLMLPVTIGVNISGINTFYPFDNRYAINENVELFVHNKSTCNAELDIPYYSPKNHLISYSYYYAYNDGMSYVNYIGGGTYSVRDTTAPNIYSTMKTLTANVDTYTELDTITSFIIANDNEDGEVIPEIVYDGYSDNYNILGEYSILFKACDSSSNCSTYDQRIKVIDTTSPTISGDTYLKSLMSNPLNINDVTKSLIANDNYDGDISNKIKIESTNYNYDIPGKYYAHFTVGDSSSNLVKTPFKIEIEVYDDIAPTIEGPTVFTSKLSNMLQINNILSNMIVHDNVDENAYKNIYVIDDTYSANKNKIGTYNVIVGSYDYNENESIPYKIEVNVVDDIIPIIDGKTSYESYLSSPLSILEIKTNLIAYDNYDGNLFNKIEISEDNYSLNKNSIGVFYISFIIKDSSSNVSAPFIVEIKVYDDVLPIIEGTNYYTSLTNEKIDPLSIKLSLSAIDNIDGDISNEIVLNENTYSENEHLSGTYFLTFYVCDKSGNISNMFKVKIVVKEDLSYLETINNSYLYFDTATYKKEEEIFDILSLDVSKYNSINTIENTYLTNYNLEGTYKIVYQIENTDYTKENITINIVTKNTNKKIKENIVSTQETKKETIFSKIISSIKTMFSKIGLFFKNLFS